MAERKGFFSGLLKGIGLSKENKDEKKEEKDVFLEDTKSEISEMKGQAKIERLINLLNREEDEEKKKTIRSLIFENLDGSTEATYHITYDSFSEGLEPVYFWVLDFMNSFGFKVEKTKEDFTASVGSAFYGEIGQRATRMQEQAIKMLGTINTVVRSIINLIYDLKEFDIRLEVYRSLDSNKQEEREAAELGLKQIWMDQVDVKKGLGAINNMTQQLQFATLRDSYMQAKSIEDIDKMDLNDRVKRVLKIKIEEYLKWKDYSKKELLARYNIEKAYLKSQVAALKQYAEWTKPYLLAAKKLDMKVASMASANVVSVFNNMEIELELAGKQEVTVQSLINNKDLPENAKVNEKYYQYIVVTFKFRSVPHSVQTPQGYQYRQGGRVDIFFKAYGLSEEELKELKKSEEAETFKLVDEMVGTTLSSVSEDLDKYSIEEKKKKYEEETTEEGPLTALASGFKSAFKPLKHVNILPSGSYFDNFVKGKAKDNSKDTAFTFYDVYKKAHDMMSF